MFATEIHGSQKTNLNDSARPLRPLSFTFGGMSDCNYEKKEIYILIDPRGGNSSLHRTHPR